MNTSRFFQHAIAFSDDTWYIECLPSGKVLVHSTSGTVADGTPGLPLKAVDSGRWVEVQHRPVREKRCSQCKQVLDISKHFHRCTKAQDGLRSACIDCRRDYEPGYTGTRSERLHPLETNATRGTARTRKRTVTTKSDAKAHLAEMKQAFGLNHPKTVEARIKYYSWSNPT